MADSDDTRNSPAAPIIEGMKAKGADVRAHDTYVEEFQGMSIQSDMEGVLRDSDCLVLVTSHSEYSNLDLEHLKNLMRTPIIIDGRNVFDKEECTSNGFIYRGIGK